jgi:hypothetical protein
MEFKKIISLIWILFQMTNLSIFANPIDSITAKKIAKSFFEGKEITITSKGTNLKIIKRNVAFETNITTPEFHVFNCENEDGFIIIAADDRVIPILGYADEGSFDPNNVPPNMQKWLEGYKTEIRYAIDNNLTATQEIQDAWIDCLNPSSQKTSKSTEAVAPLISTKWDQSPYYNQLCPYDNNMGERAVTGCVATAMAQVMNYWKCPANGTGFHSYNHNKYGTISVNFGSTTYDWTNMPNQLTFSSSTAQKNAVATLMYHCGVSVDMNYNVSANGGSSAYVISARSPIQHCSEYALKTYFGYANTLRGIQKDNYTQTQWINLLKTELDADRPVLYRGQGSGGGHAFVCDGYDNNNYFHFNWGWSGQNDGYYALTALAPGSGGAGGGSYEFTDSQQAIIGIKPADGSGPAANFSLSMYEDLSTSQSRYWFGNQISVTAKIQNDGPDAFSGEFGAAIFNSEGSFIDFLSVSSVSNLQSGYYTTRTFTHSGGAPFIPGYYITAVFYRTNAGSWTIVPNNYGLIFDEINYAEFEVYYSSNIETNSNFTINEGKLIQTQTATVNVDVKNSGSTTFYGKVRVSLSNLDGSHVQNIGVIDITDGLQANYHYINGLNFSGTIAANPGTYLMLLAYQKSGESAWYYAGSSDYQNPVFVIVEAAPVQADSYEQNNTKSQAYDLPASFSNNSVNIKTNGSNFHIGSDLDYYKVVLPSGYDYTISPRLHDEYNSGNGQKYTVDALFSYSLNNTNAWSESYDDVMTSSINVKDGGALYFKVAPYFSGSTGTYLMEIKINRTVCTNIEYFEPSNSITIFPNPAKDILYIKSMEQIEILIIHDISGKEIKRYDDINQSIDISFLTNGIYIIKAKTRQGEATQKIVKI